MSFVMARDAHVVFVLHSDVSTDRQRLGQRHGAKLWNEYNVERYMCRVVDTSDKDALDLAQRHLV